MTSPPAPPSCPADGIRKVLGESRPSHRRGALGAEAAAGVWQESASRDLRSHDLRGQNQAGAVVSFGNPEVSTQTNPEVLRSEPRLPPILPQSPVSPAEGRTLGDPGTLIVQGLNRVVEKHGPFGHQPQASAPTCPFFSPPLGPERPPPQPFLFC